MEIWKPVIGYEGHYEVSSYGRVKSLKRKCRHSNGGYRDVPEKILNYRERSGYPSCLLVLNGTKKNFTIHTLVLEAFVGPKPKGMECCHNNGNRSDNRLKNLRWDTRKENKKDAINHGTTSKKLDSHDIVEIKALNNSGLSMRSIAKRFGVTHQTVSEIMSGKIWSHVE